MFGAELQIQRRIGHIAQHGTGGCIFSRATAIKQCVTNDISSDEYRIKNVIYAGQHV